MNAAPSVIATITIGVTIKKQENKSIHPLQFSSFFCSLFCFWQVTVSKKWLVTPLCELYVTSNVVTVPSAAILVVGLVKTVSLLVTHKLRKARKKKSQWQEKIEFYGVYISVYYRHIVHLAHGKSSFQNIKTQLPHRMSIFNKNIGYVRRSIKKWTLKQLNGPQNNFYYVPLTYF